VGRSISEGSAEVGTSSKVRKRTRASKASTPSVSASATPDPIPGPSLSGHGTFSEVPSLMWSAPTGRTEHIFLESMKRYEDLLRNPGDRSISSLSMAMAEIEAMQSRERGHLAVLISLVEARSTMMDAVLERLEIMLSIEKAAVNTAGLQLDSGSGGPSQSADPGVQAEVVEEGNEGGEDAEMVADDEINN
jgi:hypothetical protein